MLKRDELVDLYRRFRQERILSVYLDGNATDFAERKSWRKRLEIQATEAGRRANGAGPEDEAAFGRALQRIEGALADFDSFLPDRGWVGFATPDDLIYGEGVRVPMPDLVRWEDGLRVAPYVRALKQDRLVLTVLVDSRRARLLEYRGGEMVEPWNLNAETFLGDLTDVNMSKRPTGRSGVRGKTGTDAAQRFLGVGSERMMKKLAEALTERLGTEGHLVVGGTDEAVSLLREHLPQTLHDRVIHPHTLRVEMSDAEVRDALEAAASELTQSLQLQLLDEVVNQAKSGGRGALGSEPVEKALKEGRVDTLLVSRNLLRAKPDHADHLVGAAFEAHGEVEELSGEGADRLDQEGGGVAARLRYTL
jgi:hypothetical protein